MRTRDGKRGDRGEELEVEESRSAEKGFRIDAKEGEEEVRMDIRSRGDEDVARFGGGHME